MRIDNPIPVTLSDTSCQYCDRALDDYSYCTNCGLRDPRLGPGND